MEKSYDFTRKKVNIPPFFRLVLCLKSGYNKWEKGGDFLKAGYANSDLKEYRKHSKNRSFVMCEYEAAANYDISPHWHSGIEMIYVLHGQLSVAAQENWTLCNGEFLFLNSSQIHSITYTAGTRTVSLQVSCIWLYKVIPEFLSIDIELTPLTLRRLKDRQPYEELVRSVLLLKDVFYSKEEYADIGVNGYVFLILYHLITHFRAGEKKGQKEVYLYQQQIRLLVQYLNKHYQEDISLQNLADTLYVSPQYISKLFRQHFSMTYKQYLMKIRLEHAVYEMIYTEDSLLDISIKCGFSSQHAFIDLFKKKYNMTPSEFRKMKSDL